jgi:hypothetical protein
MGVNVAFLWQCRRGCRCELWSCIMGVIYMCEWQVWTIGEEASSGETCTCSAMNIHSVPADADAQLADGGAAALSSLTACCHRS